jgi:hypothetical protein
MKRQLLTVPQLMFVVGTRAALAAGVALLFSERMKKTPRRVAGLMLMGIGAATTVPAAKIVMQNRPPLVDHIRTMFRHLMVAIT